MINQKNLESGRSMIEMLGVLAIIGVLSVGGIAGYSKAMLKYKVNKTVDEITQISSNVRIAFGNQRNYSGLNRADVVNAYGLVPQEFYNERKNGNESNTYQTPWGDDAVLKQSKRASNELEGKERAFIIEFPNMPAAACAELVLLDWGSASGSGLVAMGINNTNTATSLDAVYDADYTTIGSDGKIRMPGAEEGKGFPITPTEAITLCGTTGVSSISWKFY